MSKIFFHLHTYSISCADQQISLIRKEFELLQYLYEHIQQPRSREQILDHVWSDEAPTDRTVDDHIYRLRKKLKSLQHLYTLDTIRGFGYQLTSHTVSPPEAPIADPHFKDSSEQLLKMYHLYGNGQALQLLLSEKTLGIQPTEEMLVSKAFMTGDYEWMLHTKEVPFSGKVLFFINLLLYCASPSEALYYYKRAMEKRSFSPYTMHEAKTLLPLFLYLRTSQFEQARQIIEQSEKVIDSEEHGFYPFFCICRLIYGICVKDEPYIQKQILTLDAFFKQRAYLREKGIYSIVFGVHQLLQGEEAEGYESIQEGLTIIQQSHFVSHYILALDLLHFFFEEGLEHTALQRFVDKKWKLVIEEYRTVKLKKSIIEQLELHL